MTEENIVIDTSILIAHYKNEPIKKDYIIDVECGLVTGFISSITLTEILKVLGKEDSGEAYEFVEYLENSPIRILDIDKNTAKLAGTLKLKYPLSSLSTADCIILASGIKQSADKIITRDGFWKDVKEIKVEIV